MSINQFMADVDLNEGVSVVTGDGYGTEVTGPECFGDIPNGMSRIERLPWQDQTNSWQSLPPRIIETSSLFLCLLKYSELNAIQLTLHLSATHNDYRMWG